MNTEYHKKYYEENKESFREKGKIYREKNKEEVRRRKKEYYSDPVNSKRKADRNKELYRASKEKVLIRTNQRRKERKAFVDGIAMKYKCQNPNCKWNGGFEPCIIEFHHFDSSQKEKEIGKMYSSTYQKIVEEINKCICLCKNCHMLFHHGINKPIIDESMLCKVEIPDIML